VHVPRVTHETAGSDHMPGQRAPPIVQIVFSTNTLLRTTGTTPLFAATSRGHTHVMRQLIDAGASEDVSWMGLHPTDAAREMRQNSALKTLRAYESYFAGNSVVETHRILCGNTPFTNTIVYFAGNILKRRGPEVKCIVSWPGIYCRSWDCMVSLSKADSLSAAVVFLPAHTSAYGEHSGDKCYCDELYGEEKEWGCKWFELWRAHIEQAVELGQVITLQSDNTHPLTHSPTHSLTRSLTHLLTPLTHFRAHWDWDRRCRSFSSLATPAAARSKVGKRVARTLFAVTLCTRLGRSM
jgi:hypothetical protein